MDSIKVSLSQAFSEINNEKDAKQFITDVFTFLHDANEILCDIIAEEQMISKEKVVSKNANIDGGLRQALELIIENIRFHYIAKRLKESKNLIEELDKYKGKVEKAQSIIDEYKEEAEKAKRAAITDMKKKLQIARDRIIATSETIAHLPEQLNKENYQSASDYISNSLNNLSTVAKEMSELGLWPDDETMPLVGLIADINIVKKSSKTKNSKKKETGDKSDQDVMDNLSMLADSQ